MFFSSFFFYFRTSICWKFRQAQIVRVSRSAYRYHPVTKQIHPHILITHTAAPHPLPDSTPPCAEHASGPGPAFCCSPLPLFPLPRRPPPSFRCRSPGGPSDSRFSRRSGRLLHSETSPAATGKEQSVHFSLVNDASQNCLNNSATHADWVGSFRLLSASDGKVWTFLSCMCIPCSWLDVKMKQLCMCLCIASFPAKSSCTPT